MVNISIVIPTYNGAKRLPFVLKQLRSQSGIESLSWEVIIVDNNSTDGTPELIRSEQKKWPSSIPLNYYLETQQGAAYARNRGVTEANGELIGYLDDDNWPANNWIQTAYEFSLQYPQAGAWGSRIIGEFETEPPEWIDRVANVIGIIDRGPNPYYYSPHEKILPPGAGLVVRREAWIQDVPKELVLNHKGKETGLASEDLEAVLYIQKAGWEVWYNPNMEIRHAIAKERLQLDYLLSVYRCIGLSRYHLRILRCRLWMIPLMTLVYLSNDLYKLMVHYTKYNRGDRDPCNHIVYTCQSQFLYSSLVSPFFLLKNQYLKRLYRRLSPSLFFRNKS